MRRTPPYFPHLPRLATGVHLPFVECQDHPHAGQEQFSVSLRNFIQQSNLKIITRKNFFKILCACRPEPQRQILTGVRSSCFILPISHKEMFLNSIRSFALNKFHLKTSKCAQSGSKVQLLHLGSADEIRAPALPQEPWPLLPSPSLSIFLLGCCHRSSLGLKAVTVQSAYGAACNSHCKASDSSFRINQTFIKREGSKGHCLLIEILRF